MGTSELPIVPYATFVTELISAQIFTIVVACAECVLAYKVVVCWNLVTVEFAERLEEIILLFTLLGWSAYFSWATFFKGFKNWRVVLASQHMVLSSIHDPSPAPEIMNKTKRRSLLKSFSTGPGLVDVVRAKLGS